MMQQQALLPSAHHAAAARSISQACTSATRISSRRAPSTVAAAAAAASPAAFLADSHQQQQDGLHQLRLLAPQLVASSSSARNQLLAPTQHLTQQQPVIDVQEQQLSTSSSSTATAVKPKQLMAAIAAAASVSELQALYQAHQPSVDHLHLASMLNRLAHTWSAAAKQARHARKAARQQHSQQHQRAPPHLQHQQPQQQQLEQPAHAAAAVLLTDGQQQSAAEPPGQAAYREAVQLLRALLSDLVGSHLGRCSSRQLNSALWVVGRFSRAAAADADIQQAVGALLHALLLVPPSPPSAAAAVQQSGTAAVGLCRLQRDGNAADIQNTMWALGRLAQVLDVRSLLTTTQPSSSSSSGVLAALDQLCSRELEGRRADGQFVANCLYGFAHLSQPAPQTFAALVHRANPNYCKSLQSQHVVCITWAAARLGHYCPQLYSRLLWRAVVVRGAMYPQGVAMLLAACARARHSPDPRAVAQLLQVCKAQWWKLRGKHLSNLVWGLLRTDTLQHHSAFFMGLLLCQVTVKLHELQPVGVATILQALLQASRTAPQYRGGAAGLAGGLRQLQQQQQRDQAAAEAAEAAHAAGQMGAGSCDSSDGSDGRGARQPHTATVLQRLQQQAGMSQQPRLPVSAAAIARAQVGMSAALSGHLGDANSQLLLRQMSAHIVSQLPQTTPHTLYNIIVSLAGVGYYEPRLYNKLAAAAAAAATTGCRDNTPSSSSSSTGVQQQPFVYSHQQCLQLLCAFSSFQHAAPELWQQLLPGLAADTASLTQQQLTQLVSAAAVSAVAGGGAGTTTAAALGPAELQMLLQIAAAALQGHFKQQQEQQQGLTAAQLHSLVKLTADCTALVVAAAQQLQQQHAEPDMLLLSVLRQTDRLTAQLAAEVCAQPQLLSWQQLLQLMHAALLLQTPSITQLHQQQSSTNSSSLQPLAVTPRLLHQLSSLAQDRPQHLGSGCTPHDLVLLLQCHTHPALSSGSSSSSSMLADAYAEALLCRIGHCSVQTLVALLQVLAAAWQQPGQLRYGNVGLVAAAARTLHSRVRLATGAQLAAAVDALEALQQQQTPLYRAVAKLSVTAGG